MLNFKGKYYIYTRCSTEEQKKKGFSHEYQEAGIRACLANNQDLRYLGTHSDTITGTTFVDRPQLQFLYLTCRENKGHVKFIFVQKWDRFGRNAEECLKWVRLFKEIGVEINSPLELVDFESTNWLMYLGMLFSMAQTESLKISDRTKDGLAQAARQGYFTASAPVGYKREISDKIKNGSKKRKVLVPDEKAPLVKKILESYLTGSSRYELYQKYKIELGLARSSFYRLFSNIIYSGKVFCKAYKNFPEEIVEGQHDGLISYEQFNQIQNLINLEADSNRARPWANLKVNNKDFYLKGSIRCLNSNKIMSAGYSKGRSKGIVQ